MNSFRLDFLRDERWVCYFFAEKCARAQHWSYFVPIHRIPEIQIHSTFCSAPRILRSLPNVISLNLEKYVVFRGFWVEILNSE